MKIVEPDFDRMSRCGIPEVVYGRGKSRKQLLEVAARFIEHTGRVIVTKVDPVGARAVIEAHPGLESEYGEESGTLVVRKKGAKAKMAGKVGIITAGTSDIPVAEEARAILGELGCSTVASYDIGVAGVHRLFPALKTMSDAKALIVVAGMEGALPSVVSGLVDVPVIGVPTSVGYGVGKGGLTALNSMLASCAPVAVVNIDNGYGAAVLAYQIARTK
ncbi:MAG: nickel pincer cofactor biosynthesis protein LarB [Candidatus Altiarchaeota archaeon]